MEICMPDYHYRRYRVPGGTHFFTVNLLERRLDTLVRHVDALREAVQDAAGAAVSHRCLGGVARSYALRLDLADGRL
jgi:hypothetical protein